MEILKVLRIFVFEMKNNIKLKGVLLEVVGTKTEGNTGLQSFDSFLEADIDLVNKKNFGFQERGFDFYSKKLKEAKLFYKELYTNEEFVNFLDDLAAVETLMLQYRSLYGIKGNLKLGTLKRTKDGVEKNYIVARCPFYNPNTIKTEFANSIFSDSTALPSLTFPHTFSKVMSAFSGVGFSMTLKRI